MVVLGAELEVAQHDGDLRARDEQDDKHEREEACVSARRRRYEWSVVEEACVSTRRRKYESSLDEEDAV